MSLNKYIFLLTLSTAILFAEEMPRPKSHANHIDHLIAATERKLEQQKELKQLMETFNFQQEEFFRGNQSKTHAAKMIHSAERILNLIRELHLAHLFSLTYLEELTLFSSLATRQIPVRP
jgi:hypothetical protein